MKVIIVEDELANSEHLQFLLQSINNRIEVVKILDSVKATVDFFSSPIEASLLFMDIHLADGIAFEIFEQVEIQIPIIFTTAYNQYAIKAFKLNSIDYLLKPIDEEELREALIKFEKQNTVNTSDFQLKGMLDLLKTQTQTYKSTYLTYYRDELIPLRTEEIAFFYIDTGVVKAKTFENKEYTIDKKLEDIELELNPTKFYRANRQFIICREAVVSIKSYFNGKLIINVNPKVNDKIIVSKVKATPFKKWMDM